MTNAGSKFLNITRATAAAFVASVLLAAPVLADGPYKTASVKDAPAPEPKREVQFSAEFAVTSDYVFRGFSQSKERPAVQAGAEMTYKMFYAGIWASGIDFGETPGGRAIATAEVDFVAGIRPKFGPVTLDLGVIYYTYPRALDAGAELDYVELKFGATVEVWKGGSISGTLFYSPEYTGATGEVLTLEGKVSQELPKIGMVTPTLSALLGYQTGDSAAWRALFAAGDDHYFYWNAGVSLAFHDRFSIDLRYWDTNLPSSFCGARLFGCDERFVATAKVTF